MSNTGGWIKLYRKILANGGLKKYTPELFMFWMWCLLKAERQDCEISNKLTRFNKVKIKAGEFIFSERSACDELPLSRQNIRTCVKLLKSNQVINPVTNPVFTIISVVNWHIYQDNTWIANPVTNPATNPALTQCQPSDGVTPLYEEVKEYKENKELIHSCANAQAQECKAQKPKLKKETTFPATFLQFWNEFPKKRSKAQALKAWNNIPDPEALLPKILETIRGFKQSCEWQRDDGRFIPYPATWLNAAGWDDEVPEPQQFRKNDFKPVKTGGTDQFLKLALAEMEEEKNCNEVS